MLSMKRIGKVREVQKESAKEKESRLVLLHEYWPCEYQFASHATSLPLITDIYTPPTYDIGAS